MTPRQPSTGLIAIATDPDKMRNLEKSLTIQKIVDNAIPISDIVKTEGAKAVAMTIDIQLTKLVASLNLKWNLNDNQIKTIVEDLMCEYPNETIEDFILVFKKARLGDFGEIYRLDSAVIFTWMKAYLEDKYKIVEDNLMREKDREYQRIVPERADRDWHQEWLNAISENGPGKLRQDLSDAEIEYDGQETPKIEAWPFDPDTAKRQLTDHLEVAMSCQERTVRERHPEFSEEQIQERLAELSRQLVPKPQKKKWTLSNKREKRPSF